MTRIRIIITALLTMCPATALAAETPEWAAPLLEPVLGAIGLALAALISWLTAEGIRWLRAHVSQAQTQEALVLLTEATAAGVDEVAQAYVDELKRAAADGRLTGEEALEARRRAVEKARMLLGEKGIATIQRALGGADTAAIESWLVAKVEQAVVSAKGVQ